MDTEDIEQEEVSEFDDIDQTDDFLDSDKEEEQEQAEAPEPIHVAKNDFDDYGKKVQKRIGQEISKRKVLEDENRSLNERLSNLETTVHVNTQETNDADLKQRMQSVQAKRKEMYDVGDIDPQVEDEWQDLRYEQKQANERKQAPKQEAAPQRPSMSEAQQDWMTANSDWYGVDEERTAKANDAFQSVLDDGFNENHPGAYKEFDKRLQVAPPEPEPEPPATPREKAPPPASPSGNNSVPKSKAKLSQADFVMMQEMGMDPRNPEDRKALLAQRRA